MQKKGEYFEELVELLERSLNPNSKVMRNVFLPYINTNVNSKAQCDLVIVSGQKPRQIITIVEVQNRIRKVNVNDFRGWIKKMEDVGAQRLICVSKAGYSSRIHETAQAMKNTVLLIQLSEMPDDQIPLDIIKTSAFMTYFTLDNKKVSIKISEEDLTIYDLDLDEIRIFADKTSENKKLFSFDRNKNYSLIDICKIKTPFSPEKLNGKSIYNSSKENENIYLLFENVYLNIDLMVEYEWHHDQTEIPVSFLKYDQDEHGTLAWLVKSEYQDEHGTYKFAVPFVRNKEGGYSINTVNIEKPDGFEFHMHGLDGTENKWKSLY